jgi:hypothetical protein
MRALAVGVIAVLASTSLRAQSPGVESVMNRLADSARTRGLPTEPLLAKAAEGRLKGADSTRIVDAVRGLIRELDVAKTTLCPNATGPELTAAASALHAGVTPAQLGRVGRVGTCAESGARPPRLVMPLVVLADLVARRVSTELAVSSLETLVSRGAPDAQFASLRTAIERDISNGDAPDAAMRRRSATVLRSLDPQSVARPPE